MGSLPRVRMFVSHNDSVETCSQADDLVGTDFDAELLQANTAPRPDASMLQEDAHNADGNYYILQKVTC